MKYNIMNKNDILILLFNFNNATPSLFSFINLYIHMFINIVFHMDIGFCSGLEDLNMDNLEKNAFNVFPNLDFVYAFLIVLLITQNRIFV